MARPVANAFVLWPKGLVGVDQFERACGHWWRFHPERNSIMMPSRRKRDSSIDIIMMVIYHELGCVPCGPNGDIRWLYHINSRLGVVSHLLSVGVYMPPSYFSPSLQRNRTLYRHGRTKMYSQGEDSNVRTRRVHSHCKSRTIQ